jgi:RNA polymerase sigma-70 factor (ECF subfamily)
MSGLRRHCAGCRKEYQLFELNRQWRDKQAQAEVNSQQRSADQMQRDIYETHRHRVFSLSYYMTANEVEAESMLEATFITAFTTSPTPDSQGVDSAFLCELEARIALTHEAAAVPESGSTLQRGNVRRTDMEESLGELPPRERLVFLLHDVEGYKPDRIATLLGSDGAQILKTLISARIRMRNALAALHDRAQQDHSSDTERIQHEPSESHHTNRQTPPPSLQSDPGHPADQSSGADRA